MDEQQIRAVDPGTIGLAFVIDGTSCVGVTITSEEGYRGDTTLLILGWFSNSTPHVSSTMSDVFSIAQPTPLFPGYRRVDTGNFFPYSFSDERNFARTHDDEWWKEMNPPCSNNLPRQFFRRNEEVLVAVDFVHHLLAGGTLHDYKGWVGAYFHNQHLFHLWAEVSLRFPKRVSTPPDYLDEKRSNIRYLFIRPDDPNGSSKIEVVLL